MKTPFGPDQDIFFMRKALDLARSAFKKNEVPVGAIVVNDQGTIVGRGYNKVEKMHTQSAHAELNALRQAGKRKQDWRLIGHWLYVTLEPCAMCLALVRLSRLEGVVFGASSPLFGDCLDKGDAVPLYNKDILPIVGQVGADESARLLRTFFQRKRNERGTNT